MQIQIQTVLCGAYQENAYVVSAEGRDDCVVVDPGDALGRLKAAIGEKKLAAVFLTHGHFDHTLAAQPLIQETGAALYASAADADMLNDSSLNAYDAEVASLPAPNALDAVPLEDTVSAAGLSFRVLRTPGHSKGSVCFYLEDEGVLFSGDTLFMAGFGRMDLYGGSPAAMRESLRALFHLPEDVRVYPGHGGATTIGREKARYRL